MRRLVLTVLLVAFGLLAAWPQAAWARIKLITLPVRERVEIQLDNPGATLVEEERIVPLVRGVNQVDFSWANTQIDPGTVRLFYLDPGMAVSPLRWSMEDVTTPYAGEGVAQALILPRP